MRLRRIARPFARTGLSVIAAFLLIAKLMIAVDTDQPLKHISPGAEWQ
jgi:hypothetical protein